MPLEHHHSQNISESCVVLLDEDDEMEEDIGGDEDYQGKGMCMTIVILSTGNLGFLLSSLKNYCVFFSFYLSPRRSL